ncbi:hypothetical protein [Paenibacillus illinoisensis]|uniref:hypothetical protein n=1 Tax=Paenibacillus illinoisensis TaxID=59845 RepID=UPI00301CF127
MDEFTMEHYKQVISENKELLQQNTKLLKRIAETAEEHAETTAQKNNLIEIKNVSICKQNVELAEKDEKINGLTKVVETAKSGSGSTLKKLSLMVDKVLSKDGTAETQ